MTLPTDPAPHPDSGDCLPLRAQVLLLDMDGTLIDSGPAVERSWNQLFAELGVDLDFGPAKHGRPARQVLAEVLTELGAEQVAATHRRGARRECGADVA